MSHDDPCTHDDLVGVTAYRLLRGEDYCWILNNCISHKAIDDLKATSPVAAAYAQLLEAVAALDRLIPEDQLRELSEGWR